MNRKLLTAILLFVVLLLGSVSCFANTNTNLGTEVKDSADKSKTTLQNAGEGIKNIASDIGSGVQGATTSITQGVQNMFDGHNGTTNRTDGIGTTNGNYTAARTSTDRLTGTTMTNTAWVWLILGIVGVVIVALTWYYVTQNNDSSKRH